MTDITRPVLVTIYDQDTGGTVQDVNQALALLGRWAGEGVAVIQESASVWAIAGRAPNFTESINERIERDGIVQDEVDQYVFSAQHDE